MRVLLVEDDPDIRTVLAVGMENSGLDVIQAGSGEDAVGIIKTENLDLAIVDLRLPDCNGIDLVKRIRSESEFPIVILTAFGDSYDVVAGLESGADDFLSKPIAPKELVARLRALMRRVARYQTSATDGLTIGRVSLSSESHRCDVDNRELSLTRTEFAILAELMVSAPRTVTKIELLERVWGYDYLGDSRLVDMQIYRLRRKFVERGVLDFILTVRGVGFQILLPQ